MARLAGGSAAVRRLALSFGLAMALTAPALAAEEEHGVPMLDWSFAGIFGKYDTAQLQRGLQIYRESCHNCHSMNLVAFRTLGSPTGPHMSEAAVKQIASEYTVTDISNETGQPFDRPATPSDFIPPPFPNRAAAAAANGGAAPPDFSLIAKARAEHRGFPGFIVDAFAGYAENGPDYIHALLNGYQDPPAGVEPVPGKFYNPVYLAGNWIAMPPPLTDGMIKYADGSPETVEQYSKDIAAFLMWAAEPHLVERKQIGFRVMIFIAVLALLFYLTKQKLWRNVEH